MNIRVLTSHARRQVDAAKLAGGSLRKAELASNQIEEWFIELHLSAY
jgi:hypothetical protein